ncbi:MAG: quinolinate synthase NadA [Deltaproteobacteria bacterium]|nr:quinolinate synthase NadA [Deltaproteobacteria bacterium]
MTDDASSPGSFPSLTITASELVPRGSFAEAQALYLRPDAATISAVEALLERTRTGVVAHFYMDPELQGVLAGCEWPFIHVSDSLAMADAAIGMVEKGAERIVVLGVDFMSENVRAMLDAAGHESIPVHRVSAEPIGCSLAESAESDAYLAYLDDAAEHPRALHVVYINTSLRTKALAHARVPTLTCTSSNVVRTILQADAEIPDLSVFFGPDTYMGENLDALFGSLAELGDDAIRALHPEHDATSVRALVERLHHFEQGNCVVHHMFGAEVVGLVRADYPDAHITAHLEVPGEMFALGLRAQREGRGVVGSTSDILGHIEAQTRAAMQADGARQLQFVLGTEAGMVTPIVRRVQELLRQDLERDVAVEIIFPVASEAIAPAPESELGVVPGVVSGEGCTLAGGCATCPYMKMNSLANLRATLERDVTDLSDHEPRTYPEKVAHRQVAELGSEPILHMRHFSRTGQMAPALVEDVITRYARRQVG